MVRFSIVSVLAAEALVLMPTGQAFTPPTTPFFGSSSSSHAASSPTRLWSSSTEETTTSAAAVPDFNGVEVAKTGGKGAKTASEKAVAQALSLGAPGVRPTGGHYLTKGGIQVTANVQGLEFSTQAASSSASDNDPSNMSSEAVIESLIDRLDSHKGVLLTSSYEFPGRYARWSLGFVDPPLEVSGRANHCTIKALNDRGKILLPAVEQAMQELKQQNVLAEVNVYQENDGGADSPSMVQIDVTVVPPPDVGTFSEEERSRQVRPCITCGR